MRDERKRLGLSQSALGELCGVQKGAQINYEKGDRAPDASYLMQAVAQGVDVLYLLTGEASSSSLTEDERRVLALFRLAPGPVRQAVLAALAVGESPSPAPPARKMGGVQVNVHPGGSIGGVIDGSANAGSIYAPVTFNAPLKVAEPPKKKR